VLSLRSTPTAAVSSSRDRRRSGWPGDGAGSGAHRARRQRGGIRSLHGGHLRVSARPNISLCDTSHRRRCRAPPMASPLSGRRGDVRSIVQHSIPDTGWCTVSSPRLASNPFAGYPPSVSEPVAQRPVVGPPWSGLGQHERGCPAITLICRASGGQRGGADRRLCPVWRPLRFLAEWGEAGRCQCVVGLVRNTRRNLPI
jgi:hypothetical protein